MSYYHFNRQEILQKTKEKYSKEKAAEYYSQKKEAIKEKSKNLYKKLVKRRKRQDCRVPKKKISETFFFDKRNFLGDKIPKKNEHYTCIACITIDFVMKMEKKNYPQVYLEECKYRIIIKKRWLNL